MKKALRHGIESGISCLPFRWLTKVSGQRCFQVFYHTVHRTTPQYFRGGYRVKSPEEFERDIDWLLKELTPISLDQIVTAESSLDLPKRSFLLSFDDGYREVAEIVAPVLRRKGVPAVFFVCSELIDNRNWLFEDQIGLVQSMLADLDAKEVSKCEEACLAPHQLTVDSLTTLRIPPTKALEDLGHYLGIDWNAELERHAPYVTAGQLAELISQGVAIGGHGIDHRVFESMDLKQQLDQIRTCLDTITSLLDIPYRVFAFPYGEFGVDAELFEAVIKDGAADRLFGTRGLIDDQYNPYLWQRLWCENHSGALDSFLRTHLAQRALRHWRGKNVTRRQGLRP